MAEIQYSIGAKVRLLVDLRAGFNGDENIPGIGDIGVVGGILAFDDYSVDFPKRKHGLGWKLQSFEIEPVEDNQQPARSGQEDDVSEESATDGAAVVTPADYAAIEAAGETTENVFGKPINPDEAVAERIWNDKMANLAFSQFATLLNISGAFLVDFGTYQIQEAIKQQSAEIERLQARCRELEGDNDHLNDAVGAALYALGVDPSDWSGGLTGVKAAIESNLQIGKGQYDTRDDWGDVDDGTITDALFTLLEQRDAARKALKPFAQTEKEIREMRESVYDTLSVSVLYGWLKEAADALKE